jgi:hypothetical protein
MTSHAPPVSLPKSLDSHDWLEQALTDPRETGRLLGLEEILATSLPSALHPMIVGLAETDPAELCRGAAQRILRIEAGRRQLPPDLAAIELTPNMVGVIIENADPAIKAFLLKHPRKSQAPELLQLWRECLSLNSSPALVEFGLLLLARYGIESDGEYALPHLTSDAPDIGRAAIDLLASVNPGLFQQHAHTAFLSEHLEVCFRALRRLAPLDPGEAMNYLRYYLSDGNPLIRQKALREGLLLPFEQTETLWLHTLGIETWPLLLVTAGLQIACNPRPDLPEKLYEIASVSTGIKKHILHVTIQQVFTSIHQAGILTQPIQEYLDALKERLRRKKTDRILQAALAGLQHAEPLVRQAAIEDLAPYSGLEQVQKVLSTRLTTETDPEIRTMIAALIGTNEPETPLRFHQGLSVEQFLKHPVRDQVRVIQDIRTPETFRDARALLQALLTAGAARQVVLRSIGKIGEFGSPGDAAAIQSFLKDSATALVTAALRALGRLTPDDLSLEISRLLQHDDPLVKFAALEIYLTLDKTAALQQFSGLLRHERPAIRQLALTHLSLIDFSSSGPHLMEFYQRESLPDLKFQAGCMLMSNPSETGIFILYNSTHNDKNETVPDQRDFWEMAVAAAVPLLFPTPEGLREFCHTRREQQKPKAAPPAYAFQQVQARRRPSAAVVPPEAPTGGSLLSALLTFFNPRTTEGKVVWVAGVLLCLYSFGSSTAPTPRAAPRTSEERLASQKRAGDLMLAMMKKQESAGKGPTTGPTTTLSASLAGAPIPTVEREFETGCVDLTSRFKPTPIPATYPLTLRMQLEAVRNPFVQRAANFLELGDTKAAENELLEGLKTAGDNPVTTTLLLGKLLQIYRTTDQKARYAEILKQFAQAVAKLPPELGGFDLPKNLETLHTLRQSAGQFDLAAVRSAIDADPRLVASGVKPEEVVAALNTFFQEYSP